MPSRITAIGLLTVFLSLSLVACSAPQVNLRSPQFAELRGKGGDLPAGSVEERWSEVSGYPLELTEDEFVTMTANSSLPVVVEVYANWCGFCEAFRRPYRELAAEYKNRVRLATIDVERSPGLKEKLEVKGYPVFFIIKDGYVLDKWYGIDGGAPGFRRHLEEHLGKL